MQIAYIDDCSGTRVELLVPAGSATLYRLGADPARAVEFVTVDASDGQASYRIVDLARMART